MAKFPDRLWSLRTAACMTQQELADTIADKIHQCNESYFAVINVDKDFASYQATKK